MSLPHHQLLLHHQNLMSPNDAVLLIDADVLAVAGAATGEGRDDDGNIEIRPFTQVGTWIENMVDGIMKACNSVVVLMYLSGKDNFRYDVATIKPYKANRKPKPFHTDNANAFIRSRWSTYISKGCEADDLLALSMTSYRRDDVPCILCTVDKDLLQVDGWHYRWEGHNFGEVKPHFVEGLGKLEGEYEEGVSEKTGRAYKRFLAKSFKGEGYLWFMAQTITGDVVDNIPGLEGKGPKVAYEALVQAQTKQEALDIVISLYKERYGESYTERLEEQARLVYMIRERDSNSPDGLKHWRLEDAIKEASGKD